MANGLKGGARPGAGRKKKQVETDVNKTIKAALATFEGDAITEIWSHIITKAKAGSLQHSQLLFNYYYGKPPESVSVDGGLTVTIKRKVV